jgi:hypothetical protein
MCKDVYRGAEMGEEPNGGIKSISNITKITALNNFERGSIRKALEEYIANHPGKASFAQKIILDEMLDVMMWAS